MSPFLSKYSGPIFAALRFVAGFVFLCHGAQKLLGAFGGMDITGKPLFLAAGIIELVCGSMIALGLLTPIVAFIASGEMAVAYFLIHVPTGVWPILNHGEVPVLLSFLFLYISAHGSGPLSVDAVLRKSTT